MFAFINLTYLMFAFINLTYLMFAFINISDGMFTVDEISLRITYWKYNIRPKIWYTTWPLIVRPTIISGKYISLQVLSFVFWKSLQAENFISNQESHRKPKFQRTKTVMSNDRMIIYSKNCKTGLQGYTVPATKYRYIRLSNKQFIESNL